MVDSTIGLISLLQKDLLLLEKFAYSIGCEPVYDVSYIFIKYSVLFVNFSKEPGKEILDLFSIYYSSWDRVGLHKQFNEMQAV